MLQFAIFTILISQLSVFANGNTAFNPFGLVSPDPRLCAPGASETATFVRVEATDCIAQPCSWFGGLSYELGITFIPSVSTSRLALDGKFRYGAANPSFGSISFPGTYYAGLSYKVTRTLTLPTNSPLGPTVLEFWLYDETNGSRLIQRCFDYTVSVCNCPCNLFNSKQTSAASLEVEN